jgi:putative ABC transport system permease protein
MTLKHYLKTSLAGLRTNKSRTLLTILGIVIGITAIIIIMSLGNGAQNLIVGQISAMGSNVISIHPGRRPTGPSDSAQIFTDSLKEKDYLSLKNKNNVPDLIQIMPMVYGGETGSYDTETYHLTIFGATNYIADIFDISTEEGDFFTDEDVRNKADVVVIGATVREKLFGTEKAIGEKIRIKGKSFRVIGVLPKKGKVSFFNFDEIAMVPYTTAQQYILGIKHFNELILEAAPTANLDAVVSDINRTIRENHNITDPEKDDFSVQTQKDLVGRISTITDIFTAFLVLVASVSLFVGGVGIMNIMLVSVTERTQEIGLRKALGATNRNILIQFLLESVTLTLMGGIIGVLLGSGISFAISEILSQTLIAGWTYTFPINGAIIGIVVAGTIGLVFGSYPANQASKKSPMEALRYE